MAGATLALDQATEVLQPGSEDEAIAAFGDGSGITVLAGGTIVVPEITYGYLKPERVLMLTRAGITGISREGSRTTIGAMTPVAELVELAAPLGPCAANVAEVEIRAVGTVGGNLRAGEGQGAPRGDLQGAFLALGANVRSAGEGGVNEEPLEEFLKNRRERLILDVSFEEPAAGAYAGLDRPHTHDYTALAVSGVRTQDGATRLAVTGAGWWGVRLPSAEAKSDDPEAAGTAALEDVTLHDDALASAWYRAKVLPVLIRRVLAELEEAA